MRASAEVDLARNVHDGPGEPELEAPVPLALAHLARRTILAADKGIAGRIWGVVASTHNATLLPTAEAATAAATRLGLPLFDGDSRAMCPLPCSTRGALDAHGWHSAGCASVNTTRERRAVAAALNCFAGPAGVTGYTLLTQCRCGDDGLPAPASAESGVGVDGDLVVIAPGATAAHTTYMDFGSRSLPPSAPMDWVHAAENGCQPALAAYAAKWAAGQRRIVPRGARCSPIAYTPLGHLDARSARALRDIAAGVDALDDVVPFGSALSRKDRIVPTIMAAIIGATAACVNRAREEMHLPSTPMGLSSSEIATLVHKVTLTRSEFLAAAAAA